MTGLLGRQRSRRWEPVALDSRNNTIIYSSLLRFC
jgi:hypothetical protein